MRNMARLFVIILPFWTGLPAARADWAPLQAEGMRDGSIIVVAEMVEEVVRTTTDDGGVQQTVRLKRIDAVKGEIAETFLVLGDFYGACRPEFIFPVKAGQRWLLFLRKDANGNYWVNSAEFGARPVQDNRVSWYAVPQTKPSYEMVDQPLAPLLAWLRKDPAKEPSATQESKA